jgi:hypothetical protein
VEGGGGKQKKDEIVTKSNKKSVPVTSEGVLTTGVTNANILIIQ